MKFEDAAWRLFISCWDRDMFSSNTIVPAQRKCASSTLQMALFSVYFDKDRDVALAYDRFLASKTDDNLIAMLSVAAKAANLDLLDSKIKRVVAVKSGALLVELSGVTVARSASAQN